MREERVKKLVEICTKKLGGNRQLADFLGSHERTIYRWLSGETKPTADFVLDMCELAISKKILG